MAKKRGRPPKVKTTEQIVDEKINAALTPITALLHQLLDKDKVKTEPKSIRVEKEEAEDFDDDDEDVPLHKKVAGRKQKFPNKYIDDKRDAVEEIYTPKNYTPPRSRVGYQTVKVKCRVCNKRFMVDPGEAILGSGDSKMSYACDKCSSQ